MFVNKLFVFSRKSLSCHILPKYNYMTNSVLPKNKLENRPDWLNTISDAEKSIDFSGSIWDLKSIKSDEMAKYITDRLEKFGSDDPTFTTANYFLSNEKNGLLAWGLIVLLYSKASLLNKDDDESQRCLAEITEMVKISRIFHQSLINSSKFTDANDHLMSRNNIVSWNKVALLTGDFLLAKSSTELAALRNQKLIELLAATTINFAESEFLGERDLQNKPLPTNPYKTKKDEIFGNPDVEWTLRNTLSEGSILGACVQGSMVLARRPESSQKQAYLFGKHMALAWQASIEMDLFQSPHEDGTTFSLVSAPILYHLKNDASFYDEIIKGVETIENINFKKVHREVLTGPGLEKTEQLFHQHIGLAGDILKELPDSEAKHFLQRMVATMR